jgi:predicted acylesterase/phospholipase RssA
LRFLRFHRFRPQTLEQAPPSLEAIETLVLSGGGVKGVAMLGAAASLELGMVTTFVGVSVGSIVATVLAMQLDPTVVFEQHVLNFRYVADIDITRLDKTFGLDSGKYLVEWIASIVPNLTFAEFHQQFEKTLVVVATDLNVHSTVYFSHESHPAMSVREALRMSCGIPLYFSAVEYEGHLFVDGGLTNNFPLDYALDDLGSKAVLGIKFKTTPRIPYHMWSFESFLGSLVEANVNKKFPLGASVLELDTGSLQPTHFKLTQKEKHKLFKSGFEQAQLFMKKNM